MTLATATSRRALARACGLDLASYRASHVDERIRRAVEREHVPDERELASLLVADAAARTRFRRSVAVSVTGLFRDPAQFDHLERNVLPRLLEGSQRLRVWSAGAADGSELYTVAILLDRLRALDRSYLLGSDLLEENVEQARRGIYDGEPMPERLRARVHWERRDLLRDGVAPGRWSLVLCRNLAIYLEQGPKQALHEALAGSLGRDGVLLLGKSERLADSRSMGLEPIGHHAYRRTS